MLMGDNSETHETNENGILHLECLQCSPLNRKNVDSVNVDQLLTGEIFMGLNLCIDQNMVQWQPLRLSIYLFILFKLSLDNWWSMILCYKM